MITYRQLLRSDESWTFDRLARQSEHQYLITQIYLALGLNFANFNLISDLARLCYLILVQSDRNCHRSA